jgi:endonuclease-8
MPEGDTIHRAARRLSAALGGRVVELAEAPDRRSPLHHRAGELRGRRIERVEARGKHLLIHFSGDAVIHSHLGANGRWLVRGDGRLPLGSPWLVLGSGRAVGAQLGGRLLRLVSESRVRNDPGLTQLGPDPLSGDFDRKDAVRRLLRAGRGLEVGDALLDQRIIAGLGNAIRNEVCFAARISPWRRVDELEPEEADGLIRESERLMRSSLARGSRPHRVYRAARRRCPRCGEQIRSRGQGDANRVAYWCPGCQA